MAERERQAAPPQGAPPPAELLRAALEKVVFFEWRLSELASELSAAQARCAAAELERAKAEEEARAADQRAKAARLQLAELEADRSRLAALLSVPSHGPADAQALEAERARSAQLGSELEEAKRQLAANRAERERWLNEMIEQARSGDEAPAALAQFISELRGEIIALRDRQKKCDALLANAGIAPPAQTGSQPPPAPHREPEPVEQARKLWAEGRIGGTRDVQLAQRAAPAPVRTDQFAAPAQRAPEGGVAARALADQCLRNLTSPEPSRREQAARHLAAVPLAAAAPLLASALGTENDPRARAQMARALAGCGGAGAAEVVARLQGAEEAPLVRLAALEALCTLPSRARAAVETAVQDAAPAVRRRAAALAAAEGFADVLAHLSSDPDASVRAACAAASREESASASTPAPAPARAPAAPPAPARPDHARAALQRLVLAGEGGNR